MNPLTRNKRTSRALRGLDEELRVRSRTQIDVELEDGRTVTAVVDPVDEVGANEAPIRGLEAPPFYVDRPGIS